MISAIFTELQSIITAFTTMLVELFSSVVDIFYTAPTSGTGSGSLTVVGALMLVGLGSGLVIWAFKFVRSLLRIRTK